MFAREWGFNHVTNSPQYPQSNGLAERAVRSVKEGTRTFCRKTLCRKTFFRKTFCRTDILPTDTLSNGYFVERTELLEKCKRDGSNINLALLNQRSTPRDEVLGSPAQRLMSRRLNATIPCSDNLMECQQFDGSMVKDRLNQKRQQQKKFYDKQTKCLPTLESGDVI